MQEVSERSAALSAELVWFDLGLVAIDDDHADALLADPALADHRHHLQTVRAGKPHVLSEVEERLLATTAPPRRQAWLRLCTEQTSSIEVHLPGRTDAPPLDAGLSLPLAPARSPPPARADHRHHLQTVRAGKPHVLSEVEERLLANTAPTGRQAWVRLFTEQTSSIEVQLPGRTEAAPLDAGLSLLLDPDRSTRQAAAQAVTEALQPGLRTRAYIFNTLLADRRIQDELRGFPTWISAWNLDNEASDESVQALVHAVVARYDIPQRWYRLKARIIGIDRLADYARNPRVAKIGRPHGGEQVCKYGETLGVSVS